MSAGDSLSPRQFFHGSSTKLDVGGTLLPPSRTGNRVYANSDENNVYLVPSAHKAKQWGRDSAEMTGSDVYYVYGVESDDAQPLPHEDEDEQYVAGGGTIVSRRGFKYLQG